MWNTAAQAMMGRMLHTANDVGPAFPHWANAETGAWRTTPDGDWTGGAWPGMLWLAHHATGEQRFADMAAQWCERLRPRALRETAFKGFGFYYGAALGSMLASHGPARALALEAAESLRSMFDARLGMIPLGKDAEEHGEVGRAFSSIDSLQATPLLFWAAGETGDNRFRDCAIQHTTRVLDVHVHADGSVIQSSELDADSGRVMRQFTHKGYSETSIWGRAQAWAMIYAAMAAAQDPSQTAWREYATRTADWWLANVPPGLVAFWDFSDPAIPNTETDTAATAIACAALLKLSAILPEGTARTRYRDAAEKTAAALVGHYLTPTQAGEQRPAGMLIGACFNKRADSRPQDRANHVETIFGSYYLFEVLNVMNGTIKAPERL